MHTHESWTLSLSMLATDGQRCEPMGAALFTGSLLGDTLPQVLHNPVAGQHHVMHVAWGLSGNRGCVAVSSGDTILPT